MVTETKVKTACEDCLARQEYAGLALQRICDRCIENERRGDNEEETA